ncbi:MAG: hypothetical protein M3Y64_08960, partial [Gemmatimonadota bacterium]|nr:hypothetical protein [Gemmatimonadota bacterium]
MRLQVSPFLWCLSISVACVAPMALGAQKSATKTPTKSAAAKPTAAKSSSATAAPFTTSNGEWPSYGGDTRGWRYAPFSQITANNFNTLEVAWRFKTDSMGPRPEFKLEGTPLMVGGVLY